MSALVGKRVLNTRGAPQHGSFSRLLQKRGALPVSLPCIQTVPAEAKEEIATELRRAANGEYAWVLFTSVFAVLTVEGHLRQLGLRLAARLGAVGWSTARPVERAFGQAVEYVPEAQNGAALAAGLPLTPGDRVLLPTSNLAPPALADALRGRGAEPRVLEVYQTIPLSEGGWPLAPGSFDAVAFCSPSAVAGFIRRLTIGGLNPDDLQDIVIGCIGETTRRAAVQAGFPTALQASTSTIDGLIDAIEEGLAARAERKASATE